MKPLSFKILNAWLTKCTAVYITSEGHNYMRGDRGHNSAVGSRRSKTNQSWDQSVERLVEIGIDRGNTDWSLKY